MLLGLTDGPESLCVNPARLHRVFLERRGTFMPVTWQGWKYEKNGKFCKCLDITAPSQLKEEKCAIFECANRRKTCSFREKNCVWWLSGIFSSFERFQQWCLQDSSSVSRGTLPPLLRLVWLVSSLGRWCPGVQTPLSTPLVLASDNCNDSTTVSPVTCWYHKLLMPLVG